MSYEKHCGGCTHYGIYVHLASCVDFNKDGSCPCTECVVKVTCVHNVCDNWKEWNQKRVRNL